MLEALSLDGRSIIVTGGGTGLGRAMVRALARAGADMVIAARRLGPIEEAAEDARALGRKAIAVATDVTDSAQVDQMVATALNELGKVDVLINNAGMTQQNVRKPIWEISDQEWRVGIDTNLSSAFYCSRAVAKHMADRGSGKIINVASGFGLRGGRDIWMYCCGKGGMVQLTRVLAFNFARYGVTANTIVPGFIPTVGTDDMRESLPRFGENIPIGKLGKPEDMGPIAVFLSSSASDYMNGEMFTLDGGGLAAGIAPAGYEPLVLMEA